MGAFMKEDDLYIPSLLDELNLRFGRYDGREAIYDGINEIKALQAEFEVFKEGRSLLDSLRLLGVGGVWNPERKAKWYRLLGNLESCSSEQTDCSGGQAIVRALRENLASSNPKPIYFTSHDAREAQALQSVLISTSRPIFYLEYDFLTISLPMKPRERQSGD